MYIYTYILYFSMSNALVRKIFVKMPFHQPSCESISSPLRHRHIRQVTSTSGYWLDLLFGSDGVAAEAACLQRGMSSSWETSAKKLQVIWRYMKQHQVTHCTLYCEVILVMAPSISVRIDFEPLTALKISESETELASMSAAWMYKKVPLDFKDLHQ